MPFTPAHVAAVLPVVGRRSHRVVPAAWVVGSMSPDFVYFVAPGNVRAWSHSVEGLLTIDLLLGALVLAAWWGLVGAPARDLLPEGLRRRVPTPAAPRGRWGWTLVGLLGGSVTHVVWDAFTHRDGWGVLAVPGLADAVWAGQPASSVLQDGSGVLGLTVIGLRVLVHRRTAAPDVPDDAVLTGVERGVVVTLLVLVPIALCVGITAAISWDFTYLVNAVYVAFTRTVAVCAVVAVVAALGWHRLRRARIPQPVAR